ncbi:macro domain-containing protein [Cohnella soli]|uniref:Macro domain-containing protein n=1 Tax=Cohnella soli TaxID=425005 RepID=A0ABW0HVN3_9BACL
MGVQVINGDLLYASEDILGHQVNCKGVMGSGIAKAIKAAFPEAYQLYIDKCNHAVNKSELLGYCQLIECSNGKTVANLFGQLHFGRGNQIYTNYDALRKALTTLKTKAQLTPSSIALPYNIGCGLANGDWNVVEAMIQDVFSDYEVTLYRI